MTTNSSGSPGGSVHDSYVQALLSYCFSAFLTFRFSSTFIRTVHVLLIVWLWINLIKYIWSFVPAFWGDQMLVPQPKLGEKKAVTHYHGRPVFRLSSGAMLDSIAHFSWVARAVTCHTMDMPKVCWKSILKFCFWKMLNATRSCDEACGVYGPTL